jgi:midasin
MTASSTSLLSACRRIDGPLLSLWDGCESYFVRSVARLALLNTALQNPSKDLGPPVIERCRGFAVHLMVNDTVLCLLNIHQ